MGLDRVTYMKCNFTFIGLFYILDYLLIHQRFCSEITLVDICIFFVLLILFNFNYF